jgi:hypothetical protein
MHTHAGTDVEAAYDIWLSNTKGPNEVMIWVDSHGRGSGGAPRIGHATIFKQPFTVYKRGTGEIIFSLDHNEQTGTAHILASLYWLIQHRDRVRAHDDRAGGLRVGDLLDRRQAGDVHGQRVLAAVSMQDPRLRVIRGHVASRRAMCLTSLPSKYHLPLCLVQ